MKMPDNNQKVIYSLPDDGFKCYGEKEKAVKVMGLKTKITKVLTDKVTFKERSDKGV